MAQSRSPYGVLIAAIFAVLLLLLLYSVAEILFLLFIAALFSLYLGALTDFLQLRVHMPRGVGLAVALVLTLVGVFGVGWLIVPPVLLQTQELITQLPMLIERWEGDLLRIARQYPLLGEVVPDPEVARGYFSSALGYVGSYFAGIFPYLFSGLHVLISVFSVLVMGIYLTLRPNLYREGIIVLAPPAHRELVRDVLSDLGKTLRAWIVGQLLAMVILGVLTWVGLVLLNVPYALAFGVFTGVVVMVPFFGTLVSTLLPALFVLGSGGIVHALLVVLLGVVIHVFEANIVHPMIMERQVNLPPVLSILSVLIMAELLGAIGLVVAVPVLATTMVIVRRIYIHRLLEGKDFRRALRDDPVDIHLQDSGVLVHPAAGTSVAQLLEQPEER